MDIKLLLQIAGVLLGLLYLWLEYRADIRLWIVGLVMPLIHGALYYKSGLYADCSMQAYYVLAGLYGWLVWRRRGRKTDAGLTGPEDAEGAKRAAALRIGHTPLRTVPALAGVYAAAHIGLYLLLTRFTDSTVPFWDAGTTALSVVAMWMLSRKLVEQWLVWLVVDLVTVGLYLYKALHRGALRPLLGAGRGGLPPMAAAGPGLKIRFTCEHANMGEHPLFARSPG